MFFKYLSFFCQLISENDRSKPPRTGYQSADSAKTQFEHKIWKCAGAPMYYTAVKQLPFHYARSRFKNRTKQLGFYLLFNFHLQFTNKTVGSL